MLTNVSMKVINFSLDNECFRYQVSLAEPVEFIDNAVRRRIIFEDSIFQQTSCQGENSGLRDSKDSMGLHGVRYFPLEDTSVKRIETLRNDMVSNTAVWIISYGELTIQ